MDTTLITPKGFSDNYYNFFDPIRVFEKLQSFEIGFGLKSDFDIESQRSTYRAISNNGYIMAIFPYEFDCCFFIPQLIEIRCNFNKKEFCYFCTSTSFNELFDEMKKILILHSNLKLKLINEVPYFEFIDNGITKTGCFEFSNGKITSCILSFE